MFHNFAIESGGDGDSAPPLTGVCDDVGRIMGYADGPKFQWSKCSNQHFEDHFTLIKVGQNNLETQVLNEPIIESSSRTEDPITGAMRIIVKDKEEQDETFFADWCLPAGKVLENQYDGPM